MIELCRISDHGGLYFLTGEYTQTLIRPRIIGNNHVILGKVNNHTQKKVKRNRCAVLNMRCRSITRGSYKWLINISEPSGSGVMSRSCWASIPMLYGGVHVQCRILDKWKSAYIFADSYDSYSGVDMGL